MKTNESASAAFMPERSVRVGQGWGLPLGGGGKGRWDGDRGSLLLDLNQAFLHSGQTFKQAELTEEKVERSVGSGKTMIIMMMIADFYQTFIMWQALLSMPHEHSLNL